MADLGARVAERVNAIQVVDTHEHLLAEAERRLPRPAGPEQDRQQLGRAQRVRAKVHEPLPRALRPG